MSSAPLLQDQDYESAEELAAWASHSDGEKNGRLNDEKQEESGVRATARFKKQPILPTPEEAYHAKKLAAAALDLVDELRGSDSILIDPATEVASTAAAYADSRDDAKAATALVDAVYIFNKLFAESKPEMTDKLNEVLNRSAEFLPGRHYQCRSSKVKKGSLEDNASQGKKTKKKARDSSDLAPPRVRPLDARTLADAAEVLAHELKDTELASAAKAFAGKARNFADQPDNHSARCWIMMGGKNLTGAAANTPYASMVYDVLLAADLVLAANPLSASSASKSSWIQRLRLTISPQYPLLPVQDPDAEGKLIGKRQILYALALAAPVPLLTSAAGLKLFPGAWALVAGAGVAVWILATGGMVLNQYGRLNWEKLAARHLSHLGVLGAALVFIFYVYRAFFPSVPGALAFLISVAICSLCIPWVMSCIRGDDVIPEKD
ncbi:unnamed protein product [Urochloa humidicola]